MRKENTIRVLIWGKTYPELSQKYVETVCTAGVLESGEPVRLYPIRLRYLSGDKQFHLYDRLDVVAAKSKSDPRPESYRVVDDSIKKIETVKPDQLGWRARAEQMFRDPSWQFESISDLKRAQESIRRSLGVITPRAIQDVRLVRKAPTAEREYRKKMASVTAQADMFLSEYKSLEFVPWDVKVRWRCRSNSCNCQDRPHDMKVLDWGVSELLRRDGKDAALRRMEDLAAPDRYDLRFFMGNFRLRPRIFSIVGLWYPKRQAQAALSF